MKKIKSYSEMILLPTFEERLEYLMLNGKVGYETFGFDRYLNQALYNSKEWRDIRRSVIIRDDGCDLGVQGYEINSRILIHHINPITKDDIINRNSCVFDLDNLISTTKHTHDMIHYSIMDRVRINQSVIRHPGDTKLW